MNHSENKMSVAFCPFYSSQTALQGFNRSQVLKDSHARKARVKSEATDKGALKRLYQFLLIQGWRKGGAK
jgi:hypothetical protein